MDSLNPFNSNINPLAFLGLGGGAGGASGIEGTDPLNALLSLFGNQASAASGQEQGQVCSCGGGCEGGACGCGCSCCQKNQDLGF